MANPDCARIQDLITAINNTNREIDQIFRDMDALGFGTVFITIWKAKAAAFAVAAIWKAQAKAMPVKTA